MSRRVYTVDSDEPGEDEPILENWSHNKQGRGKYKRKQKAGRKSPVPIGRAGIQEPRDAEVYLGDLTEQEVIDNVRALPELRHRGKVCVSFL
jgi:hypothetical protein